MFFLIICQLPIAPIGAANSRRPSAGGVAQGLLSNGRQLFVYAAVLGVIIS